MQLRVLGAVVALALLSACGGGGATPVVNAKQGGLYTGTITPSGQRAQNVIALISETGETRVLTDVGTVLSAQLNTNGNNIAGNFKGIANGGTFLNGKTTTTGMAAGTLAERNSINASYTAEAGDRGDISLKFEASDYNLRSSFATIQGTWGYTRNNYTVTYTISSDGAVSGSDTDGCTYAGNFSLVDSRYNVYKLTAISSCAAGQTFAGLAAFSATDGSTPDQIVYVLTSDTESRVDVVGRK